MTITGKDSGHAHFGPRALRRDSQGEVCGFRALSLRPTSKTPQDVNCIWKKYGGSHSPSVVCFFGTKGVWGYLSNLSTFPHIPFLIPPWCGENPCDQRFMVNSSEQVIMLMKAWLFGDTERLQEIAKQDSPWEVKKLGKRVKNFDETCWNANLCAIALIANTIKFQGHWDLGEKLRNTGAAILAEASKWDKIWGIGMNQDDSKSKHPHSFRGCNAHGWALMSVRETLGGESGFPTETALDHGTDENNAGARQNDGTAGKKDGAPQAGNERQKRGHDERVQSPPRPKKSTRVGLGGHFGTTAHAPEKLALTQAHTLDGAAGTTQAAEDVGHDSERTDATPHGTVLPAMKEAATRDGAPGMARTHVAEGPGHDSEQGPLTATNFPDLQTILRNKVTAVLGPMGNGKSTYLIDTYNTLCQRECDVRVYKHAFDTRCDNKTVQTHDGRRIDATAILTLPTQWPEGADILLVDEIQFFLPNAITDLVELTRQNGSLVMFGLDWDCLNNALFPVASQLIDLDIPVFRRYYQRCPACPTEWVHCNIPRDSNFPLEPNTADLIGGFDKWSSACKACADAWYATWKAGNAKTTYTVHRETGQTNTDGVGPVAAIQLQVRPDSTTAELKALYCQASGNDTAFTKLLVMVKETNTLTSSALVGRKIAPDACTLASLHTTGTWPESRVFMAVPISPAVPQWTQNLFTVPSDTFPRWRIFGITPDTTIGTIKSMIRHHSIHERYTSDAKYTVVGHSDVHGMLALTDDGQPFNVTGAEPDRKVFLRQYSATLEQEAKTRAPPPAHERQTNTDTTVQHQRHVSATASPTKDCSDGQTYHVGLCEDDVKGQKRDHLTLNQEQTKAYAVGPLGEAKPCTGRPLHQDVNATGGGLAGPNRDEGCIGGDGQVAIGSEGQHVIQVDQLRAGHMIFSPSLRREVRVLATVRCWRSLKERIRGLQISGSHPVRLNDTDDWQLPRDLDGVDAPPRETWAYSLVLDAGGALLVNKTYDGGVWVATLGPSPPEAGLGCLTHHWYNSGTIISKLKSQPDWPHCQGLPSATQSYFSADAPDNTSPSPQPRPPLLVPADGHGQDAGENVVDSPSAARAVLSSLLGVGPGVFEPVRVPLNREMLKVNPLILQDGRGDPLRNRHWVAWDHGGPPPSVPDADKRVVLFGAAVVRILTQDRPPSLHLEGAAMLQLLVQAFPWMLKGQRHQRILSHLERKNHWAVKRLQAGTVTSWVFGCAQTQDLLSQLPPTPERGEVVTLCPPRDVGRRAPLLQLETEGAGSQRCPAGTVDGTWPPDGVLGLVVSVTKGTPLCVDTLLVCTTKGALGTLPVTWTKPGMAVSPDQLGRLQDLSMLACARYLHGALRFLFPRMLAGVTVSTPLPQCPTPLARPPGAEAGHARRGLLADSAPFLEKLRSILLPSDWRVEQCRGFLLKDMDLALLGPPPTGARINLEPRKRNWDVVPSTSRGPAEEVEETRPVAEEAEEEAEVLMLGPDEGGWDCMETDNEDGPTSGDTVGQTTAPPTLQAAALADWCAAMIAPALGACLLGDPSAEPDTRKVDKDKLLQGLQHLGVPNRHDAGRTLTGASGLEWRASRLGPSPPGRRLEAHALRETLDNTDTASSGETSGSISIPPEVWQAFDIPDLRLNHFVISQWDQRMYRPVRPTTSTLSTIISSAVQDLSLPSRIPIEVPTQGSWGRLLSGGATTDMITAEDLIRVFTQNLGIPHNEIANMIQLADSRRCDLSRLRRLPPHVCTHACSERLCRLPLSGLANPSSKKKRGRDASTTGPSDTVPNPAARPEQQALHQAWDTYLGREAFRCYITRLLVLAAVEPELTEIYLNWIWGTSVRCILTRLGMPNGIDIGPTHTVTYAIASLHGPRSQLFQAALLLRSNSTVHEIMLQICPKATGGGLMVAIAQQSKLLPVDDRHLRVRPPRPVGASDHTPEYCQLLPDRIILDCFIAGSRPEVEIWPARRLLFAFTIPRTILDAQGGSSVTQIGHYCPVGSLRLPALDLDDSLPRQAEKASGLVLRHEAGILHDLTPVRESPLQIDRTGDGAGSLIHFLLRFSTSLVVRRMSENPQDSLATALARVQPSFSPDRSTVTCNGLPVPLYAPMHQTIAPGSVVMVCPALQASASASPIWSPPRGGPTDAVSLAEAPSSDSFDSIEVLYNCPGKACPQSARLPASLHLKAAAQRLFGFPTTDLPGQVYLRVNNTYPRTSSDLDTSLSRWRRAGNYCSITLIGRLPGGMPGGEGAAAGPALTGVTDTTVHPRQLKSMANFCESLVARAQRLQLSGSFLADHVDDLDGTFRAFPMDQREAMLRPREAVPLVNLSPYEILAHWQRILPDTWATLGLGSTERESLEPACALATQCIKSLWAKALREPLLHNNRVVRLSHSGRGDPIVSIPPDAVDCITMVSDFKDKQEASSFLQSLGFLTPTQLQGRNKSIVFTSFRPHTTTATDTIPNGCATFSIRRTDQSMRALEAIYWGEQPVGQNPEALGMMFVSRRIESYIVGHGWTRTPNMCLEPATPHEGLKYEMALRLLTTLGLPLDLFVTAMVNMLFEAGYLGAAEILPDSDHSFATVFSLLGSRRPGRLQVRFCQSVPPKEDRTVITFNFSDLLRRLTSQAEEDLPDLLRQLSFKLVLHKKDKLTAREREASASLVMDLQLRNPANFLLERHRAHGYKTETEAEGIPVPLIEEWLCEHFIGFLRRHLSVAHSSLITSETIGVELTHDRTGKIGRASQLLIHFTAPHGDAYLAFTPHVAAALAFQLGFLVGCRGEHTGPHAQLQWCPILSLLDNYPFVLWDDGQARCSLVRVSFSLHLGPTFEADDNKSWWRLGNGASSFTSFDINRDPFLQNLERSILKHPERITPAGLVLFAQLMDQRGPGPGDDRRRQRDREEQRIIAQNLASHQPATEHIMVKTPAIIKAEESVGIRTLKPLITEEFARLMWERGFEPGSQAWFDRALDCHQQGFGCSWITFPLPAFFDAKELCKIAPGLHKIFSPDASVVPPVQASISPFCLHCRNSIVMGVYDQAAYVSHCAACLPTLVGVAAASRAIRLLMAIFDNALELRQNDDPGGGTGGPKALYRTCPESQRACKTIMDLGPHPLPLLIYSAYPHTEGHKARPTQTVLRSFVDDFTARVCYLAQRTKADPRGRTAADATIANWVLQETLQLDVQELEPLLRQWAPAAAARSDRNVLHNSTLPPHLLPPSRKRDGGGDSAAQSQGPNNANVHGRHAPTTRTEERSDTSAHALDRRPTISLTPSGQREGADDEMHDHLPSGRPPDSSVPPAPSAPAAPP